MCGRFVLTTPPERLAELFEARVEDEVEESWRPSWNVPPTRRIPAVRVDDGTNVVGLMRWGLVPTGFKKPLTELRSTFNARDDKLLTSRMWSSSLTGRRCLIPADGFYERRKTGAKPYFYFERADHEVMAFAGLYTFWQDPSQEGLWVGTCTLITTTPGHDVADVHDRQPVILEPAMWERWIDPGLRDTDEVRAMIRSSEPHALLRREVGSAVGNWRNDSSELVEPVSVGDTTSLT